MPRYTYTVKDVNGKTISSTDEAANQETLVARLQQQGYFVVNIQTFAPASAKKTVQKSTGRKFTHTKVKLEDLLVFCRQLATMIESGVTLTRALNIIVMQVDSKQMFEVLSTVKKDVEQGISLSAALAKHPRLFNQFWVSLMEVGEASGTMPMVLEKLAFYLEQQAAFRSSVVSAMIYPAVLFVVAVGAILCFALFVGPRFKGIFESFDIELPIITVLLLNSFDFIKSKFFLIALTIGVIIVLVKNYAKTPVGRRQIENFIYGLPKFGYIYKIFIVERFTSQMSILVDSGVPILYALDITQRMIGNKTCEEIVGHIKDSVREGKLIAEPMNESGFFPPMAVQMITIGEETGELAKMLKRVSDYYQSTIETFMKRFATIIEPIMLIFMGGTIGVLVIAMFLPIFSLATMGM